jgi:uncharacterized membrane protein YczE
MKMNKELLLKDLKQIPKLIVAFLIIAYGMVQMKDVSIGMHAWATLTMGLMKVTNLNFGQLSQLIGLTIIIVSITIKIYPGLATLLNMFFIGFFIDLIDPYPITFVPDSFFLKLIAYYFGIIIFSYGIYLYLSVEMGAGPRDGLMVGLVKLTGFRVAYVRPAIELTVLIIGAILGGKLGIGTVLISITGGYILDWIFQLKNFDAKKTNQRILTDYLSKVKDIEAK